ncbi:MAG TPA: ketosteroid isomerase-related protein [Rudaea sp.]|nr:ketosteroid isomerase-related protein [Rudaea sp.]
MIIDGARAADRTNALVLRFCTAFSRGDIDAMLDCVADDVVHDINQGEREIGKAALRAYMEQHARRYREDLRDVVVMSIDDGTRAAAEFCVHGVYQGEAPGLPPAQGQRYVLTAGVFFAINQGKIARVTPYYNQHDRQAQIARAIGV